MQWSIVSYNEHIVEVSFDKLMVALANAKAATCFENVVTLAFKSSSVVNGYLVLTCYVCMVVEDFITLFIPEQAQ